MSKKNDLIEKLLRKPYPTNFTTRELDLLMSKCGCVKSHGGRGPGLRFYHSETKRFLTFDGPHPGNEIYRYQIKMVIEYLRDIGEIQ